MVVVGPAGAAAWALAGSNFSGLVALTGVEGASFLWGFGWHRTRASSFASREACQQNGHGQCGDGKTHVWVLDVSYKTKVQVKRFGVQVWPH